MIQALTTWENFSSANPSEISESTGELEKIDFLLFDVLYVAALVAVPLLHNNIDIL